MKLNQMNVNGELQDYLEKVDSLSLPILHNDVLASILALKREPVRSGSYPEVSLFEASNRIMSDLVILFGVRQLLADLSVGSVALPFTEYEVRLGVEGGNDVTGDSGDRRLAGEAFNVARSFFQGKKSATLKKLKSQAPSDYQLIMFNADAVPNPDYYIQKSQPSMLYLPIDLSVAIHVPRCV